MQAVVLAIRATNAGVLLLSLQAFQVLHKHCLRDTEILLRQDYNMLRYCSRSRFQIYQRKLNQFRHRFLGLTVFHAPDL